VRQEDINSIISSSIPDWRNRQIQSEGDYLALQAKYHELIYAVEKKFDGETRHQTALRYIRQADQHTLANILGKEVPIVFDDVNFGVICLDKK